MVPTELLLVLAGGTLGIGGALLTQLLERRYRQHERVEDYFRQYFPTFAPLLRDLTTFEFAATIAPIEKSSDEILSKLEPTLEKLKQSLKEVNDSGFLGLLPAETVAEIQSLTLDLFRSGLAPKDKLQRILEHGRKIQKHLRKLFNIVAKVN